VGLIVQKSNVVGFNMPSKTQVLLASGRAIVASVPLNGTAARAVTKSQGGMVVSPESPEAMADAILHLYHHPEEAAEMGRRGRQFAMEHYSFERALDRYEQLFQELPLRSLAVSREQSSST
jgi:colanic acid biosynthesis glycosyl transferase WcaI